MRAGAEGRLPGGSLLVLAVGVFLALTGEVLPVGVLQAIASDLHVGVGAAGLLVSAYAVVVMVTSIPLALLLARLPRRWVLFGLLVGYAVTSTMFGLAPTYAVAVVARLLGGVVHAGFFAAVYSAAAEISPVRRRGRATAWVSLGATAGLALGVPAGAALGVVLGWRTAFLVLSTLFLAVAVVTVVVLQRRASDRGEPLGIGLTGHSRRAVIFIVGGLIVVLTLGHYTPYTYIDLLLQRGHISTSAVAWVLLVYGIGAAAGAAAVGAVADRAPRRALVVAVCLVAASVLLLAASTGAVVTVSAAAIWGAGFGMLTPLLQTIALQATTVDLASALVNATFNAGIAGGALLGAALLVTGQLWLLAAAGAVLALAALLLIPSTRQPAI